jgi:hypothetical protein
MPASVRQDGHAAGRLAEGGTDLSFMHAEWRGDA